MTYDFYTLGGFIDRAQIEKLLPGSSIAETGSGDVDFMLPLVANTIGAPGRPVAAATAAEKNDRPVIKNTVPAQWCHHSTTNGTFTHRIMRHNKINGSSLKPFEVKAMASDLIFARTSTHCFIFQAKPKR